MLAAIARDQITDARRLAQRPTLGQWVSPGIDVPPDFPGPPARCGHRPVRPARKGHPALPSRVAIIQRKCPSPAAIDAHGKPAQFAVKDLVVTPHNGHSLAERFLSQLGAFCHGFDPSCVRHEAWFRRSIKTNMRSGVATRRRVAQRSPLMCHPLFYWVLLGFTGNPTLGWAAAAPMRGRPPASEMRKLMPKAQKQGRRTRQFCKSPTNSMGGAASCRLPPLLCLPMQVNHL